MDNEMVLNTWCNGGVEHNEVFHPSGFQSMKRKRNRTISILSLISEMVRLPRNINAHARKLIQMKIFCNLHFKEQ